MPFVVHSKFSCISSPQNHLSIEAAFWLDLQKTYELDVAMAESGEQIRGSITRLNREVQTDMVCHAYDITRDKIGLVYARKIRELLDGVVRVLESDDNLPDAVQGGDSTEDEVDNPFS